MTNAPVRNEHELKGWRPTPETDAKASCPREAGIQAGSQVNHVSALWVFRGITTDRWYELEPQMDTNEHQLTE